MDISNETDLNKLKAMAYDEMVVVERSQNNLRLINTRINQVMSHLADDDRAASDEQ